MLRCDSYYIVTDDSVEDNIYIFKVEMSKRR
jgi:hypothetical protein